MSTAVITGATGFLGSHFLLNFVGTRITHAYLLMRGSAEPAQRTRLREVLDVANQSYVQRRDIDAILARTAIVCGDITADLLGVDADHLDTISNAQPREFWHFAASLNYEQRRKADIHATNVTGTTNVLEFCKTIGIEHLYHCSTAYVCGTKQGAVEPVLHDLAATFSNYYEESKCVAEHFLHDSTQQGGPSVTVWRPSVVIGNSETKRTGGSTSGLYGLLRELEHIKTMLSDSSSPVRVWFARSAAVNVVAVDEVMRQIRTITDQPDHRQRFTIHHLVSAQCPTNNAFFEEISDALALPGLVTCDSGGYEMTGLEELMDQRLTFYQSYIRADRSFVPSVPDAASVTDRDIRFFVREGLKTVQQRDITSVFRFASVTASDGVALNTYRTGNRSDRAVLICNAVGMPADLVSKLAARLADTAPVLTWESRGLPSKDSEFTGMDVSLARQAHDGIEVLASENITDAVIVGWCAGSRLALEIAAHWDGRIRGLVLLNGGYNLQTPHDTPFEVSMNTSMPKISQNYQLAEVFYRGIFARSTPTDAAQTGSDALLRSASADDVYLASLPFHSADNLYRYSRLTTPYIETPLALHDKVKGLRVAVMTGDCDKTASPESSRAVAALIPDATFTSIDGADHYSLYWDEAFLDRATQFTADALR